MLKEERHQYILNRINRQLSDLHYRIKFRTGECQMILYGEIWQNWMSLVY